MDARAIITAVRDGQTPEPEALTWFARGLSDRSVSPAQAAAFAMAICLKGLDPEGRVALTLAMRDSGDVMRWDLDGPVLDKHSTGGLGDCVSLVLAPALAACGAYVPMISGRGLGHTGGTLDKLEAIPGLSTDVDDTRFRQIVRDTGCAIVSASAKIAPADKRLYAIRDVTATVESLDLITASILSKKLAAGLDGLILDVKVGSGAFMKTTRHAQDLARALVTTANQAGCPTTALITDMNQPVAPALGNALEVAEAMAVLSGRSSGRLAELTGALGGALLADGGLAADAEAGMQKISGALSSGHAAEHFGRMSAAMGAPLGFVENWTRYLPEAPVIREVTAKSAGYVAAYEGERLGLAAVALGAGRRVEGDRIDPAVGFSEVLPLGSKVQRGQPLVRIHAARETQADQAEAVWHSAVTLCPDPPETGALIHERIT